MAMIFIDNGYILFAHHCRFLNLLSLALSSRRGNESTVDIRWSFCRHNKSLEYSATIKTFWGGAHRYSDYANTGF